MCQFIFFVFFKNILVYRKRQQNEILMFYFALIFFLRIQIKHCWLLYQNFNMRFIQTVKFTAVSWPSFLTAQSSEWFGLIFVSFCIRRIIGQTKINIHCSYPHCNSHHWHNPGSRFMGSELQGWESHFTLTTSWIFFLWNILANPKENGNLSSWAAAGGYSG